MSWFSQAVGWVKEKVSGSDVYQDFEESARRYAADAAAKAAADAAAKLKGGIDDVRDGVAVSAPGWFGAPPRTQQEQVQEFITSPGGMVLLVLVVYFVAKGSK